MRRSLLLFLSLSFVILGIYLFSNQSLTNKNFSKINSDSKVISQSKLQQDFKPTVQKTFLDVKSQQKLKSKKELAFSNEKILNRKPASKQRSEDNFLNEYPRNISNFYINDRAEKWSVFEGIYVTLDSIDKPLFKYGQYSVTDRKSLVRRDKDLRARLFYDENQKQFVVFTGRLVAKFNDLFDISRFAEDYHLRLDSVNADINRAYLSLLDDVDLGHLRVVLDQDSRIKNFYFEVISDKWQKE